MTEVKQSPTPTGQAIGGWLFLVGLIIVLSPLKIIVEIIQTYSGIFSDGAWEAVTTPGSEAYHPLWGPFLIGEIAVNAGFVLAFLFLAFLFFAKKKAFPNWFIGLYLSHLVFLLADTWAVTTFIDPDEPMFDPDTVRAIFGTIIFGLAWFPYMLFSKRIKETFVKN